MKGRDGIGQSGSERARIGWSEDGRVGSVWVGIGWAGAASGRDWLGEGIYSACAAGAMCGSVGRRRERMLPPRGLRRAGGPGRAGSVGRC